MDELSIVVHMAGSSEEIAQKLRDKGFTDLNKIKAQSPVDLAKGLEIDEALSGKIISAAKSMSGPAEKIVAKVKPRKKSQSSAQSLINKITAKDGKIFIRKHWRKVLPLAIFTLIGYWLGRRN